MLFALVLGDEKLQAMLSLLTSLSHDPNKVVSHTLAARLGAPTFGMDDRLVSARL